MILNNTLRPTILVVDDNPDHAELITEIIYDATDQYEVAIKTNGEQAIEHLKSAVANHAKLPKLIFMDIKMPRMNGIEALVAIKEIPKLAQIPIIMLSTSTNDKEIKTCLCAGALMYISKPLTTTFFSLEIEPLIEAK